MIRIILVIRKERPTWAYSVENRIVETVLLRFAV